MEVSSGTATTEDMKALNSISVLRPKTKVFVFP